MSTLTDRYVWAVVRTIPENQRTDIERELRASIGDAIESRADATGDEGTAERDVLTELGEPERLAAGYTERPTHLIGPAYFFDYWRLLRVLLATVVPIVVIVIFVLGLVTGDSAGDVVGSTFATGLALVVHMCFWVTLVFAVIERTTAAPVSTWTPDTLPQTPDRHRVDRNETIVGIAFLALVEIGFVLLRYRVGRWTWPPAIGNVGLNLAFSIPAVWLALNGRLVNPVFLDELAVPQATQDGSLATVIALVLVAVPAWDAVDGLRRAWQARRVPVGQG